jgi:threonylcarbamoyladenosine tRNA methylthiotransferase MtaB
MFSKEPDYYVIRTLGCKANLYDSQLIEAELQSRGWKPWSAASCEPGSQPRVCIVNSCTVTDEADRQSRKLASRLGRDNPRARVVVTGCGAEVDPERLARSQGIHYVVGNQDKPKMVELILQRINAQGQDQGQGLDEQRPLQGEVLGTVSGYAEMISRHPMDREWPTAEESFFTPPTQLQGHSGKTRAFLKIQEGCNSFCTYCIIPYGRGPSRSLDPKDAVMQVQQLVSEGIREVVITGTNVGDYGVDWGMDPNQALADLFGRLLSESGLSRLRVSSLDPTEITPALVDFMKREPRFCPHFHVSLQAAHSRILRLMKRKYGIEQVRDCLNRIASDVPAPLGGPFIGMDVITGFPGETLEEFEESFEELTRLPWSRLHVFPYSEREGTPATRLPGTVRREERVRRARQLSELSLKRLKAQNEHILKECVRSGTALENILLEKPSHKAPAGFEAAASREFIAELQLAPGERLVWANGYTPNYLRVVIPMGEIQAHALRNQLVSAKPFALAIDTAAGDVALVANFAAAAPPVSLPLFSALLQ